MPRRRSRKNMRGGFLDSLSNTLSGWSSSLSQGATNMWSKTKNAMSSTSTTPSSYQSSSSYNATSTYGGRRRRRSRRHFRGGSDPISGIKTAQPQTWVGGRRTRKHKRRH